MLRRLICLFTLGTLCCGWAPSSVRADDSAFGFMYGYALGQASQFRYRLPAPPYFAVYPPVYYGERFERPYGDSPFASWPTLQANPAYMPVLRQESVRIVPNPHCEGCGPSASTGQDSTVTPATSISEPRSVTIVNPFFKDDDRDQRTEFVSARP